MGNEREPENLDTVSLGDRRDPAELVFEKISIAIIYFKILRLSFFF